MKIGDKVRVKHPYYGKVGLVRSLGVIPKCRSS